MSPPHRSCGCGRCIGGRARRRRRRGEPDRVGAGACPRAGRTAAGHPEAGRDPGRGRRDLGRGAGRAHGLRWIDPGEPVLAFLASAGFGLIMLVAGSHVPLRDPALRLALRRGVLLALLTGALVVAVGYGVAALFDTGHALLYAVLFASSSAALIMPVIDEAKLDAP